MIVHLVRNNPFTPHLLTGSDTAAAEDAEVHVALDEGVGALRGDGAVIRRRRRVLDSEPLGEFPHNGAGINQIIDVDFFGRFFLLPQVY